MKNFLLFLCLRLFLAACLLGGRAWAQIDPHFSQYYNQPMLLNPALTGAIDGDYRASAIWRSQYGNTLVTKGLTGEVVTDKNTNFGLNIIDQGSSDQAYHFTNADISMAYTGVRFGPNADHYLVLALQGGIIDRRFDPTKLQFGDQWTSGLGYESTNSSGEVFSHTSVLSFDAGVGVAYYDAVPDKAVSLFGGLSAFHLNSPANPFLSNDEGSRLPIRYVAEGGVRINNSDIYNIVPSVIFMKEGAFTEKVIGGYLQLYASDATDFICGANWRMGDAIIPFAGIYYKGMTIGMSYDATVSSLSTAATRTGTLEVSISYIGIGKSSLHTKSFYCPRF